MKSQTATIIGIDCATNPKKMGLALCQLSQQNKQVKLAHPILSRPQVLEILSNWTKGQGPVLIALDAPLGWPEPLARALINHKAGGALNVNKDYLFNRETDRVIHQLVKKKPLDVGADRIARTAESALRLMAELKMKIDKDIPLAWNPDEVDTIAAIEVYPAATLKMYGWPSSGYKSGSEESKQMRRTIVHQLSQIFDISPETKEQMQANDDNLDSVVCCLAGLDFLSGNVIKPKDRQRAKIEGWIWVKAP